MQPTPFVTEFKDNPMIVSYKQLSSYIKNIQSKLSYADFKQKIVLLQNYQPLSKIIRRTKALKQEHEQKYKQDDGVFDGYEQQRLDNQIKKLESILINLKGKIQALMWKKQQLTGQVQERKNILNQILTNNKEMIYLCYQQKQVPRSLNRSLDIKLRSYNSSKTLKEQNVRMRKLSSHTQRSQKTIQNILTPSSKSKLNSNGYLFQQCLVQLSKSLKTNTASNVQGGIFLDILETSKSQQQKYRRKNESNNLVYQVLLNSYKEQEKKNKVEEQLGIEWQTFRKFNGKQVLGLVMVKQRGIDILKAMCSGWNE